MTSFVDLSRDDVMREYRTVVHYMRYALAAYGWPIYMMMHTGTGLCRILPRLRSAAGYEYSSVYHAYMYMHACINRLLLMTNKRHQCIYYCTAEKGTQAYQVCSDDDDDIVYVEVSSRMLFVYVNGLINNLYSGFSVCPV